MRNTKPTATLITLLGLTTATATADEVTPTDLDTIDLGPKIVGPVGPEVQTTFVNDTNPNQGIGDLNSSVSCPVGFAECLPPSNPTGTIYTYAHTVTPGIDLPNDTPFPPPSTTIPFDNVTDFHLAFDAAGFNGIAGYSFTSATTALGAPDLISIEQLVDGSIAWTINSDGWDTDEPITFFWQTTQPPSGPGGVYTISDATVSGSGAGPLPTPIPEPTTAATFTLLSLLLTTRRKQN